MQSTTADYALQDKEMNMAFRNGLMQLSPQSRLVFEMSREEGLKPLSKHGEEPHESSAEFTP